MSRERNHGASTLWVPARLIAVLAIFTSVAAAACSISVRKPGWEMPGGVLTAIGWTADGHIVTATGGTDRNAALWYSVPGRKPRAVPIATCDAVSVPSIFAGEVNGRVGIALWCAVAPAARLVYLDLPSGQAATLASFASALSNAQWSSFLSIAYAQYGKDGCTGIAEIAGTALIRPDIKLSIDGKPVDLAASQPSVDAQPATGDNTPCNATVLSRHPAISPDGQRLAFFVRACDEPCRGLAEFDRSWRLAIYNFNSRQSEVLASEFQAPLGVSISNNGEIAISGATQDGVGLQRCRLEDHCSTPHLVKKGKFVSPALDRAGKRIAAVDLDNRKAVFIE